MTTDDATTPSPICFDGLASPAATCRPSRREVVDCDGSIESIRCKSVRRSPV